jgi:hypothetical protein
MPNDDEYVTLTHAEADYISETLIAMAVRLPMKYRNHADALDLLKFAPPFANKEAAVSA